MRVATGEDFVVEEPTPNERALVEILAEGFCGESELLQGLERRGLTPADTRESLAQLDELGLLERKSEESPLSSAQRERYDRQLIYWADLATAGDTAERLQHRLAQSTVVVLGCGGLGSWAASALACAGVGRLTLIDHDRVELSNLNRQLLYREADLGRLKVEAAAEALTGHNSEVEVTPVRRLVSGPNDLCDVLNSADLLIATADWPPYELPRWVNRSCLAAEVPFITAGQFPPLIRVGPMVLPGRSACLGCLERQTRREHPLYDEAAARRSTGAAATLGAASGAVGSLLAMEAIHLLTGGSRPASVDAALIMDLRRLTLSREPIRREPGCPDCAGSA